MLRPCCGLYIEEKVAIVEGRPFACMGLAYDELRTDHLRSDTKEEQIHNSLAAAFLSLDSCPMHNEVERITNVKRSSRQKIESSKDPLMPS